jgi:hypothetical protein
VPALDLGERAGIPAGKPLLSPFVFERLADEFFDATTLVPVGNLNDWQASANRVTSRPGRSIWVERPWRA